MTKRIMKWVDGTRVRVRPHVFCPAGSSGTVRPFPEFMNELCGGGVTGCKRVVEGASGPIEMVWVVFDRNVHDIEGDGPYREGEMMAEYLEVELGAMAPRC